MEWSSTGNLQNLNATNDKTNIKLSISKEIMYTIEKIPVGNN